MEHEPVVLDADTLSELSRGHPGRLIELDLLERRVRDRLHETRTAEESSTSVAWNGRSRSRCVSRVWVGISSASIDAGSVEIPSRA